MLINELCSMVSTSSRKMDKSTVLRATIAFLRAHNDVSVQNQDQESQENWKPSFLSNEEFTHLMLESLEGFLLVLSLSGQILYTSESVASLLGYLPHELHNIFILDILHESNHGAMCELLSSASSQGAGIMRQDGPQETYVNVDLYMKRGNLGSTDSSVIYEPMNLKGTFLTAVGEGFPLGGLEYDSNSCSSACSPNTGSAEQQAPCLVAMVRLQTPQLMHELILCDGSRNEFSSRHSLEWKFLFLDHRAPPIIGYLPFEVLGTSGYDYYHVEDLEKVAAGQEALMQTGEGTSCHYRFLTKGQQWIWLQTRYYITYHQWSSKPEFVVCTNTVMSYDEDLTHSKAAPSSGASASYSRTSVPNRTSYQSSRVSSAPSVSSRDSLSPNLSEKSGCAGGEYAIVSTAWIRVLREERSGGAGSCGNQLSLPFTEACTITRESPATGGRLAPLASSEPASSRLQHEPMDQRPPYQTTTVCRAPLITLTALQPIAATFAGSGHCGTAAAAAQVLQPGSFSACLENDSHISTRPMHSQPQGQLSPRSQQQQQSAGGQHQQQQPPQQDHFQDYLRRRHQALQQQILRQQEELRRVSEQLMLVHFINPNLTATVTSANAPLFTLSLPTTTLSVPTSTIAGPTGALTPAPYLLATAPAGCTDNSSRRDSMHQTQSQQLQHQQQTLQEQQQQLQQDRQSSSFLGTVPQGYVAPVYPLQLPTDQMIFTSNFNASSNIYMDASGTGSGEH
ncbi:circadian locomoter output cycles kaput protein Clock [Dermacentor variabilis]|uniref:circadian locomoter output cycles kaput protein Clock n=1 Tax=Dermacentor variabilis TaxID=34621 RepID=UPI003F5BB329